MLNAKDMQHTFNIPQHETRNKIEFSVPNHIEGVVSDTSEQIQHTAIMMLENVFMYNFGNAQCSCEQYVTRIVDTRTMHTQRESVITISAYADDAAMRSFVGAELPYLMTIITRIMRVQYPLEVRINGTLLSLKS